MTSMLKPIPPERVSEIQTGLQKLWDETVAQGLQKGLLVTFEEFPEHENEIDPSKRTNHFGAVIVFDMLAGKCVATVVAAACGGRITSPLTGQSIDCDAGYSIPHIHTIAYDGADNPIPGADRDVDAVIGVRFAAIGTFAIVLHMAEAAALKRRLEAAEAVSRPDPIFDLPSSIAAASIKSKLIN